MVLDRPARHAALRLAHQPVQSFIHKRGLSIQVRKNYEDCALDSTYQTGQGGQGPKENGSYIGELFTAELCDRKAGPIDLWLLALMPHHRLLMDTLGQAR